MYIINNNINIQILIIANDTEWGSWLDNEKYRWRVEELEIGCWIPHRFALIEMQYPLPFRSNCGKIGISLDLLEENPAFVQLWGNSSRFREKASY